MTPQEWWWEYDTKVAEAKAVKGGQAGPDWDKLRELHKAKKNGNASTN